MIIVAPRTKNAERTQKIEVQRNKEDSNHDVSNPNKGTVQKENWHQHEQELGEGIVMETILPHLPHHPKTRNGGGVKQGGEQVVPLWHTEGALKQYPPLVGKRIRMGNISTALPMM